MNTTNSFQCYRNHKIRFKEVGSNFKEKYQVLNGLPDDRYICSGVIFFYFLA